MADLIPNAYLSLGILGALCGALALRMSMYRLAGSPGEDKPNSPLNRFSELQLLNAEWAPVGAFLTLAAIQRGVPAASVNLLTALFVGSRLSFVASRFMGKLQFPVGATSMTVTYVATFGLSYLVAFP
jgi:hypothetical protein